MLRAAIAFCLALGGCAETREDLAAGTTLHVSEDFTDTEVAEIAEGVAAWNEAVPALDLRVERGGVFGAWGVRRDAPAGVYGHCSENTPVIRLAPDRIAAAGAVALTAVFMHELGHALGLFSHVKDGHTDSGLMAPHTRPAACVDAATLAELCGVRPELCDGRERVTCS